LLGSRSVDNQQRAHEISALLREGAAVLAAALPQDASCEDLEVRLGQSCNACLSIVNRCIARWSLIFVELELNETRHSVTW
jgi:AP-4 complex subunit epsilon-1